MKPLHDAEGRSGGQETPPSHRQIPIKERIQRFTWPWFACTMSTGSIAVAVAQQPFIFDGLETIGKVFFILDLVLFVAFTMFISIRFIKDPAALGHSLHHPQESFFFGTWWVSLALILNCMQQYGVAACGPWLVKTLGVLFWMYAACALLVAIFQYHLIFTKESLSSSEALPAWILPSMFIENSKYANANITTSLPIFGTRSTCRRSGE
jgi:tellurite resistance protein TehA-like permease